MNYKAGLFYIGYGIITISKKFIWIFLVLILFCGKAWIYVYFIKCMLISNVVEPNLSMTYGFFSDQNKLVCIALLFFHLAENFIRIEVTLTIWTIVFLKFLAFLELILFSPYLWIREFPFWKKKLIKKFDKNTDLLQ